MSTAIYENDLGNFTITKFSKGKGNGCGYQITLDGAYIVLDHEELLNLLYGLNTETGIFETG